MKKLISLIFISFLFIAATPSECIWSGVVLDKYNTVLPGVVISITSDSSRFITASNAAGWFSLPLYTSQHYVNVVVSYAGYEDKKFVANVDSVRFIKFLKFDTAKTHIPRKYKTKYKHQRRHK